MITVRVIGKCRFFSIVYFLYAHCCDVVFNALFLFLFVVVKEGRIEPILYLNLSRTAKASGLG